MQRKLQKEKKNGGTKDKEFSMTTDFQKFQSIIQVGLDLFVDTYKFEFKVLFLFFAKIK